VVSLQGERPHVMGIESEALSKGELRTRRNGRSQNLCSTCSV
jgi:hypothetical protein